MKRNLSALAERTFDLAVIGGGILGAGIARDAALRGLSVALVEQSDFASGTSSRSTKLVHGGLRYLEQLAWGLVAESCRERSILLDMAPHVVKPLSFLLPVYRDSSRSLATIRVGTTVYDWLTPRRHPKTPRHRVLSPAETVAQEPLLPSVGLRGAVLFYDCQMDDARLCIETILNAGQHGATCANYCRVTGFRTTWDRLDSAQVVDQTTGAEFDLRAKIFINATGPWAERLARLAAGDAVNISLGPTKGVHLVIPRLNRSHGIYFQAANDRRMIFLLPWDDVSLLGTTDTDYRDDPAAASANKTDVAYLLRQLELLAPGRGLTAKDVITSFAGVRALLRADLKRPSRRSREERIVWQGENMLSVAGGKYTTFRAISDKAVKIACRRLRHPAPPSRTANVGLEDRRPPGAGEQLAASPSVFASDITHACTDEMAVTVADVMRRRTRLALSPSGDDAVARRVSSLMAASLGWDQATQSRQLGKYLAEWTQSRSWSDEPA